MLTKEKAPADGNPARGDVTQQLHRTLAQRAPGVNSGGMGRRGPHG